MSTATTDVPPVVFLDSRRKNAHLIPAPVNAVDELLGLFGGLVLLDPVLSEFLFEVSVKPTGGFTAYVEYCYDRRNQWLAEADAATAVAALWAVTAIPGDQDPVPEADPLGWLADRMVAWVRHHRVYQDPTVEEWVVENWGPEEVAKRRYPLDASDVHAMAGAGHPDAWKPGDQ